MTTAATGPLVEHADVLQYELDEGPCITAWQTRRIVRIDDMATETRFPRWTEAVASLRLRASLSAPMVAGDDALGAIKLYAETAGSYSEHDEQVLALFARQAAILLANVQAYENAQRLTDQLHEALAARDTIGQAKGIIMAQQGVNEEVAFAALVRLSQQSHHKLRDVARQLIETTARPGK